MGARRLVFRYALFGKHMAEDNGTRTNNSGQSELPGNDFMITLGDQSFTRWPAQLAARWHTTAAAETNNMVAATFMHEMGHTLNLHHGGANDTNCSPNYLSVMNYALQFNNAGSARDARSAQQHARANKPPPRLLAERLAAVARDSSQ
jgi:hypothetical protein